MSDESSSKIKYNGYVRLFEELKRRWREPSGNPTFDLFFIGSFLMFAAAGVWLELARLAFGLESRPGSATAFRIAIATYFPAVLGAALLQLLISETLRSLRALGFIIGVLFTALTFILVFAVNLPNWAAISLGLAASAGALACWRIVYADDQSLRDDPEPIASTGNIDPVGPLLGGSNLTGYDIG